MVHFTVMLAGVPIAVSVLHASTQAFCADYLIDAEPLEYVRITQDDIDEERRFAALQDERDGVPTRRFPDNYLETLALYRKIATMLVGYDTVVFHGSVVARDGRAYLFTAPSGTGKTTHTRYWLRMVEGSYVLNGDKPLLRIGDGCVMACGTPWQGKECLGCNEDLPLQAICILRRDSYDHIEPTTFHDALPTLIQQTNRPSQTSALTKTFELVGRLGMSVDLYTMGCTMNEAAALVSYGAMVTEVRD